MRVRLFFIFIVFLSGIAVAGEDSVARRLGIDPNTDERYQMFKQAYTAYKATKSPEKYKDQVSPEYVLYLENKERERIAEGNICADCPNLLLLTEQVNGILQHLKEDPKSDIPPAVLNEINSLEGMFFFTQEEQRYNSIGASSIPCKRSDFVKKNPLDPPDSFDHKNHIMIFSKNINFKSISQAQFVEHGVRKTYFFRGAHPHEDIVIRVMREASGETTVSYFQDKKYVLKANVDMKIKKNHERNLKTLNSNIKDGVSEAEEDNDKIIIGGTENGKKDQLEIEYGWKTEGSGFIPKKVTILQMEGVSEFDTVNITGGAEISSKKQAIGMKVSDKKGDDYVGVEVKANSEVRLESRTDFETFAITGQAKTKGVKQSAAVQLRNDKDQEVLELSLGEDKLARLGVPMKFNVYDTGVVVDGKLIVGEENTHGGSFVLSYRNDPLLNVGVEGNRNGSRYSVGHERKISQGTSLSIKLTHDEMSGRKLQAGWVQFNMAF